MSTDSTDIAAPDSPIAATAASYHPTVLREQMAILRREAAARAKAENEITAEHEAETEQARSTADKSLAATRKKYAVEIDSAKHEHAALVQKADAFLAAERKKLDEARQARAKSLEVACGKKLADLKEDMEFQDLSATSVHKDQAKQPLVAFAKAEKELARTLAQFDEAVAAAGRFLLKRGVKVPTEVLVGGDGAVGVGDPLGGLVAARDAAKAEAEAIVALPAARQAFSGGLRGAMVVGPIAA
ncbi:MAG: hypothetical protein FJ275_13530, partial [Planctomycetes bacterium]|nr:hypothetical protein [Planctomycetota bacterium]